MGEAGKGEQFLYGLEWVLPAVLRVGNTYTDGTPVTFSRGVAY